MGTSRTVIWAAPIALAILLAAQGSQGISHTLPLFDQNLEGNKSHLVNLLLENTTMAIAADNQDYQELELGSLYHFTKVHGNSHADEYSYGETTSKILPTEKEEDQSEPELANLRSYKGVGPKLITGNDIADDHHDQEWWDSEEAPVSTYPQLGNGEGSRKKRAPQSIPGGIPNINASGAVGSAVDAALQIGCEVVDLVMGHMDQLYKKCADGPVIPDEAPTGGKKEPSFVSDRTNCVSKSGPSSYKNIKVVDMRNLPRALKRIVHKAVLETLRTTNEVPVGPELTSAFRKILEKRGAAQGYNLSKLDIMLGCFNTWDVSINLWNGHAWMVATVGDLTVFLWHNGK